MIALKVTGELENSSSVLLNNEPYPMGQVIRGAFGYIFLQMGLDIAKSYWNGHPILYFRDCFVKHGDKCGGSIIPIGSKAYVCNKCGQLIAEPTVKDSVIGVHLGEHRVQSFYNDGITEKKTFKFEIILNLKKIPGDKEGDEVQRLSDFLSALEYAKDNDLNIGKRGDKGFGKITLKNVEKKEINKRDIDRRSDYLAGKVRENNGKMTLHFLSDIVSETVIMPEDILRDCKNAAKYFGIGKWAEDPDEVTSVTKYEQPKMTIMKGRNDPRSVVQFLDLKIDPLTNEGVPLNTKLNVISRGTKLDCLLNNGENLDDIYGNDRYKKWFDTLASAEMLRGFGHRTSFGKGQFRVL
ncbi:MAG: hypothetical protein LAN71_17095 [Acidobacteriia bacterium]|nr:hypothetical protein [Terriglobia bacterium]